MIVPIRRMFLTVGMVAMTATLLASCGGGGSSDDNASPTSNQQAVTTTGSPAQTGGGSATSSDTAKVRFINVWGGDPSDGTIDLYKATGVGTYSKVLSGLALGSASDWIDVDVEGDGNTATGLCDGNVTVAPVSIDGKSGSTWVVALYGPATAQKLAAIDVTPG